MKPRRAPARGTVSAITTHAEAAVVAAVAILAALASFACTVGDIAPAGGEGEIGGTGGMAPRTPPAAPAPPPPNCPAFAGETIRKSFAPKLFGNGDDPSEDAECAISNPERGFFLFRNLRTLKDSDLPRGKNPLVYGKAVLADYRDRRLDDRVLAEVAAGFATVRRAGYKVLPRFYYADGADAPLATTDRAVEHIAQLAPLLRDNADVIAALHAGFLGYWGEWHADGRIRAADRKRVLTALMEALPPARMVLVRRPSFKREAFGGPLTEALAFSSTPLSRLGHVNDCFLASDNDEGTYGDEAERRYAITDSAFTPVGGETCAVNPPRSDCASAVQELARHHWSFANAEYSRDVMARWKSGGCAAVIGCRLGYRFVVRGHESVRAAKRGGELVLTLELSNDGYARPFNPRPVQLVLSGPAQVTLPTAADARTWIPAPDGGGDRHRVCLAARVPDDLPAGTYQLGIALPDPAPSLVRDPRYALRLAGAVVWDEQAGINRLDVDVVIE